MENLQKAVNHVQAKEFTEFRDVVKGIVKEKMETHPRMVQHKNIITKFEKQQEIYSQIEDLESEED